MQILRITLAILLLAVTPQHVYPSDKLIAPPPHRPVNNDLCIRILQLQPGPNEDNTLFCWFLCLGCGASGVWCCYFSACYCPQDSVFPLLLASILGVAVQICLMLAAACKISAPKAVRFYAVMIVVPGLCALLAVGLKHFFPVQYTGWFGLSLTGLSHSFRFSSAVYRNNFDIKLFIASVVGSVGGFLWLGHPQLCLSREYKIASYVVAVIRTTEAIVLCSYAMARQLQRIEGYAESGQGNNGVPAAAGAPPGAPPPPPPAAAAAGVPPPPAAAAVVQIDEGPVNAEIEMV